MLKFIIALIVTLAVAFGQDTRCLPESNVVFNDDACDGTPDNPCSALMTNLTVGAVHGIYYEQRVNDDYSDVCIGCEDYWSTVYVRSIGDQTDDPNVNVQLSPNAIRAICNEGCLNIDETGSPLGFSGVCQLPNEGERGCMAAALPEDDVCSQPLLGDFEVHETGRCEVGADSPDDGRSCSEEEPCLVKLADKTRFRVGALVNITYTQRQIWSGEPENDFCAENRGSTFCGSHSVKEYAIVEDGLPEWGSFEFTPHGMRRFCGAPCLDSPNGTVTGICQEAPLHPDGSECVHEYVPAFGHELCGVPLLGTYKFDSSAHRLTLGVLVGLLVFS